MLEGRKCGVRITVGMLFPTGGGNIHSSLYNSYLCMYLGQLQNNRSSSKVLKSKTSELDRVLILIEGWMEGGVVKRKQGYEEGRGG